MKMKRIVATIGVGAVCVATGGLAAPVIGTAIGGTMGLAGAAATSAGLAALGGGSLAAGGAGMAGGIAVVKGAAGLAGVGAKTIVDVARDNKKTKEERIKKEAVAEISKAYEEKLRQQNEFFKEVQQKYNEIIISQGNDITRLRQYAEKLEQEIASDKQAGAAHTDVEEKEAILSMLQICTGTVALKSGSN